MKVQPHEFRRMRGWFAHVLQAVLPPGLIAGAQPLAELDQLAERSPAKAREGLSMAIGDLVELTASWPPQDVQNADAQLAAEGLPTLSEVRARFSKGVGRAVRRGRIRDEVEYHAVRNAAELAQGDEDLLWKLLAAYEERATG